MSLSTATTLQIQGLKGEHIIDDRCWIVKAHHPCLLPLNLEFTSNKVICCVRNPLDVFISFASFTNTMNHSVKPDWDFANDYPAWWDWWVRHQVDCMKKYFDVVFKHSIDEMEHHNPIYIVRYEDMVKDSVPSTSGILQYLLEMEDISGTNAERRVNHFAELKKKNPNIDRAYVTKNTTGIANANADKYTAEQMAYIKQELAHFLHFFGYVNNPDHEGEPNETAYFNYEEPHPEESQYYYKF